MKTSARNHLLGSVIRIDQGTVDDEVTVMLDGSGHQFVAVITRARVKILGLEVGTRVVVLIKTHDVILMTDDTDVIFSARNQLKGTVLTITESTVSADVRVRLDRGGIISAVIARESVTELGISAGSPVTVMVRATNVIIGRLKDQG